LMTFHAVTAVFIGRHLLEQCRATAC
jgi:hypothetical protein